MKSKRSNTEGSLGEVVHGQQPAESEDPTETTPVWQRVCVLQWGWILWMWSSGDTSIHLQSPTQFCRPTQQEMRTSVTSQSLYGDLVDNLRDGTSNWGVRQHLGSPAGIPSQWWCNALLLQHWFELNNFCSCPTLATDLPFTRVTAYSIFTSLICPLYLFL